jgi:polar amino acid transport system substrate-binding protein
MASGNVFLSFFLLALLLPGQGRAGDAVPVINVGVFTVAPFIVANAGEVPKGVMVDFFDREIAPRMGVKFNWLPPVTVARLEQNLTRGTVSFTPILTVTPGRIAAKIRFAGTNHIHFEPCIAVLPEHRLNVIRKPGDLAGMSIGWVQSAAKPEFLNDPSIKFDLIGSVDWERVNMDKLKLGRIQGAFFSDQFTPRYYAAQNGIAVKLLKLPTPGVSLYGAFSPVSPAALVKNYEHAAKEAFADGRWESYLAKALAGK